MKICIHENKIVESDNPIAKIYGDGHINTYEHSADGFYPNKSDTLAWAIYNNDVETINKLHDGNLKTYEEPDEMTMGWRDDYDNINDDSTHYWYYDWYWDYDQTFVKDFRRLIGEKDNQDALRLMLKYEPDFIVCPADINNAIHAGYDKDLIAALIANEREIVDDEDLEGYLDDVEFYDDEHPNAVKNLLDFLSE